MGYAVGDSGIVLKTLDGGLNWASVAQTGGGLLGVSFINADTGWAVGDSARILHTTNGGISWAIQHAALWGVYHGVQFVNDTTGYVVGEEGAILKTTDAGGVDNLPPGPFTRLLPVDSSQVEVWPPVTCSWSASVDPDGDPVRYRFEMWGDNGYPVTWDTVTADTHYTAFIDLPIIRTLVGFHWRVIATDEADSTLR